MQQKIIILDFGSQTTQLIGRRVRELNTFCEILPYNKFPKDDDSVIGVILSGSPYSVYDPEAFKVDLSAIRGRLPILGICYGAQYMSHTFGGKVEPAGSREYGRANLCEFEKTNPLFAGFDNYSQVWMSHGDTITAIPEGWRCIASTDKVRFAAYQAGDEQLWGVQFHPEVFHTVQGGLLLKNFVVDICGSRQDWSPASFVESTVQEIRAQVGNDRVILGLSGGVDSSVCAVLLNKAIGDRLTCIFVDHGLLRKGEGDQVMNMLGGKFGLNIIRVDASKRFLDLLAGVDDPEKKRKIIGNEFVYVFDDEASKLKGVDFLAQGTLYTDVIESGTETAQTIKSHHNVGGLPEDMQFELIEPLNTLFKDEVRALGTALGMPNEVVWRQPFPGPGLAIRVMGDITPEKLETVRESDAILREEIAKAGLERDIWQYFTVNTGVRSVGVMGDGRTYDYTIAVRAITSIDGMTADFARVPWDVLQKISVRIVNEVDHVNRVVYDITSKPPATVEWE